MAAEILVVHPDPAVLAQMTTVLAAAGYDVCFASSLHEASAILASRSPGLLLTALRLRGYNGLQLVIRGRLDHPRMGAIVIDRPWDAGLEAQTIALGAVYLAEPVESSVLLARVVETLTTAGGQPQPQQRRWPRRPVPAGVAATVDALEAALINVSYSGLRFELPASSAGELPTAFEVCVRAPEPGGVVGAELMWMDLRGVDPAVYGAAIIDVAPARVRRWRRFVDSVA